MNTNEIVAMHEAGHVLALAAAGIYSELTCVYLREGQYEGQFVRGLTIRNGLSLTDFSQRLTGMKERLEEGKATASEFAEFMINNAVDCCFPHICFFAGGYAIENCWNPDDSSADRRAAIDKRKTRENVLPAMVLPSISDETFNKFWNWGVGLVKGAIVKNEEIALRLVGNFSRHGQRGVLDKESIDAFFGMDALKIACDTDFKNDSFVGMLRKAYEDEFRESYPLFFNV